MKEFKTKLEEILFKYDVPAKCVAEIHGLMDEKIVTLCAGARFTDEDLQGNPEQMRKAIIAKDAILQRMISSGYLETIKVKNDDYTQHNYFAHTVLPDGVYWPPRENP